MIPSATFGFEQLITELLRGLAEAVADRPGETEAQRMLRHQIVVFSTMAFMPRDALETMLAGQCVMLDHLLRDGMRDLPRCQPEPIKLRVRSQLTAIGRLFLKHLGELKLLQARPLERIAMVASVKPNPQSDSVEYAAAPANTDTTSVQAQPPSADPRIASNPPPRAPRTASAPPHAQPNAETAPAASQPASATAGPLPAASRPAVTTRDARSACSWAGVSRTGARGGRTSPRTRPATYRRRRPRAPRVNWP